MTVSCIGSALKKAKEIGVPCQTKTLVAGGNDSGAIHSSVGGIRTVASIRSVQVSALAVVYDKRKAMMQSTAELAYAMYLCACGKMIRRIYGALPPDYPSDNVIVGRINAYYRAYGTGCRLLHVL